MRRIIRVGLLALVAVVASGGCGQRREPGLTERQTEQILQVQKTLAAERTIIAAEHAAVGKARDELEADRRKWNERQRSDPIIAQSIRTAGTLLACCVPLLLVAIVAWAGHSPADVVVQSEADLIELLNYEPPRLESPSRHDAARITHQSVD